MKKRYIYNILMLSVGLILPLLLASCHGDEEEPVYSENCYISGVTLGTMKRTFYSANGTPMTVNISGSLYPMVIDQRQVDDKGRNTIVSSDSLPYGTRLSAVLVNVTFEGLLSWRKADVEDAEWQTYNSTDSMDVSAPLEFRVYSLSGRSYRTYWMNVTAHQQRGDSTVWEKMEDTALTEGLAARKLLHWNGKVTMLAYKGTGALTCLQHDATLAGTWSEADTEGTENAVISTLQKQGNRLYMSTTGGTLIASEDARTWTETTYPVKDGLVLAAATDDYLYALCDRKLYRSNGGEWEEEKLDDDAANLPVANLNAVSYALPNGQQRLLLAGERNAGDSLVTFWAKGWEKTTDGSKEAQATWMYYTPSAADKYALVARENMCILPYDGGLQALGGKSHAGGYHALDSIFHSSDHGISWRVYEDNDMAVDSVLKAKARTAEHLAATVDEDNFLWIAVDNEIWRGRINRLGFKKK